MGPSFLSIKQEVEIILIDTEVVNMSDCEFSTAGSVALKH